MCVGWCAPKILCKASTWLRLPSLDGASVITSMVTAALLVHKCSGCLKAWWSRPCGQHLLGTNPTWRKHRLRGWPAHL